MVTTYPQITINGVTIQIIRADYDPPDHACDWLGEAWATEIKLFHFGREIEAGQEVQNAIIDMFPQRLAAAVMEFNRTNQKNQRRE